MAKKINDLNVFEQISDMMVILGNKEEGFKVCIGPAIARVFKTLEEAKKWIDSPMTIEKVVDIAIACITIYDENIKDKKN